MGRTTLRAIATIDGLAGGACSVSTDGFVWYELAQGVFPAIDFQYAQCALPADLTASSAPPVPTWARPLGPTKTLFVATSLEEAYSASGMAAIARIAHTAGIPVSWLVDNPQYLVLDGATYDALHAASGDDVEIGADAALEAMAREALPWYRPAVLVAGAGRYRDVAAAAGLGDAAFWGITWNSHGTDDTADLGAPWGTYCADPRSYKRPSPTGDCSLLAMEWTARDLTRAYLSDTDARGYSAEAAFSTDPDDVIARAGFDASDGARYVRELVDAYAAAGERQPIVMMSQQEPMGEAAGGPADDDILAALYGQAVGDGMHATTIREASALAKTFSAAPRAIAFPFLGGGIEASYNGVAFMPATIDYHDAIAGMTFISGHTLPSRLFEYARDPTSATDRPLDVTLPSNASYPSLENVSLGDGALRFTFTSAEPIHFGIALWANDAALMLSGPNVTPAGRAGVVVTFDLPAGRSVQNVPCPGCTSLTFHYAT